MALKKSSPISWSDSCITFRTAPKHLPSPCLLLYVLRKGMKARQFVSGLSLQAQAQNKPKCYLIFHTCVAMKPTASKQSVKCVTAVFD